MTVHLSLCASWRIKLNAQTGSRFVKLMLYALNGNREQLTGDLSATPLTVHCQCGKNLALVCNSKSDICGISGHVTSLPVLVQNTSACVFLAFIRY